ncbi:hypothetical protein CRG98_009974 [Punica granatum]|nr:hypothetical protein CRG98_009974 [Punica granatum]
MEIQHFSDEHPLELFENGVASFAGEDVQCHLCTGYLFIHEAVPVYGCRDCGIYLHKHCAKLVAQVEHPLHPLHPLILDIGKRENGWRGYRCSCCQKTPGDVSLSSYHCSRCNYDLDPECAALVPTMKLRDPSHLFFLFEEVGISEGSRCSVCGDDFSGTDSKINSPIFVCAIPECVHALHLHCAPITLPETVRHEFHNYHDLVYTKSVAEGGHWDGHYCDACEEKRDPKFPVYYCMECNFACHVFCAISKELPSLIEAYENDCLQRGASLDAFLRYYEDKLPRMRSEKEKIETNLKEIRLEIEALRGSLGVSELSAD